MNLISRRTRVLSTAILLLLPIAGCSGEKTVSVEGRLLQNGQPFKIFSQNLPPGDKGLRLVFVALGADGTKKNVYPADVKLEDATFRVIGGKSKGIPMGKYRISVSQGAHGRPDELKDAFGQDNSPLTIDITEGKDIHLDVDVGTKKVTVQ